MLLRRRWRTRARRRHRRRLHEAELERLCKPRPLVARAGQPWTQRADGLVPDAEDSLAEGVEAVEGGGRGNVVGQEVGLAFTAGWPVALHVSERYVAHRAHSSCREACSSVEWAAG